MNRKLFNLIHTRRGLALISVLAMVTLATVIVLALFSVSDTEFKASKIYAGGNSARQFGDSAVNVVIGQIRSATVDSGNPATPRLWSSQPGAIRVYNTDGTFFRGHKLYSDSTMVVTGTTGDNAMSGDAPDAAWDSHPDRYVDINEPVVRAEQGGVTRIFFPVVDPRAAVDDSGTSVVEKVEGFSYSETSPVTGSGGSIGGVVAPGVGVPNMQKTDIDKLRLPMPVEWMYLLKDGSVGTVNDGGNWAGAGSSPDAENPIMGRVAFWTDDETSKININTASEPGYWAVPTFYHERDKGWADSPPALNEYQRFPGHPATVALSTVLYPSADPKSPAKFLDAYYRLTDLAIKESIYDVIPKIASGGSRDGTSVYVKDDVDSLTVEGRVKHDNLTSSVNILPPGGKSERLFASLDEFIFSQNVSAGKRDENNFTSTGITPAILEKTRFFMTAHSRAPELNLFGRPRVAMWPVPDATLGSQYRTGYDNAIATVATLSNSATSANTYYFSRKNPMSALEDIGSDAGNAQGLLRNAKLMNYLDQLMMKTFPGGSSFQTKYGGAGQQSDYRQILVQIFDYIRCTNLYDSFLAPKFVLTENGTPNTESEMDSGGMDYRWEASPPNKRGDGVGGVEVEPGKSTDKYRLDERYTAIRGDEIRQEALYRTYTAPRFKVTKYGWQDTNREVDLDNEIVASGAYPGHGQVTPAEWEVGGQTYKGFGRFPTLSEVGLHFICTADGLNDAGSYRLKTAGVFNLNEGNKQGVSGGRTAEKLNYDAENTRQLATRVDANTAQNIRDYWYSNFPREPTAATITNIYGCQFKSFYPRGDDTNPANHPGCKPENWNATLESGVPLAKNEKRIQVALLLEFFIPSVGFTKYSPEWTFVLDAEGLNGIKVRDKAGKLTSVFSTTENQVLKSNLNFGGTINGLGERLGNYPLGGTTGPQAITTGRRVKAVGNMPEDPGYDNAASSDEHGQLYNYPLVGSFVTVDRIENMTFVVEKPLTAKIYADHDWQKHEKRPVQTIELKFPPKGEAPPPELVRYSVEKRKEETYVQNVVDACRWWAFNYGGALGRYRDTGTTFTGGTPTWRYETNKSLDARTLGRFAARERGSVDVKWDTDLRNTLGAAGNLPVSTLIFGYAPAGGFNGVLSRPQDRDPAGLSPRPTMDYYAPPTGGSLTTCGKYKYFGSDTVRSIIPKYGDYRILAARTKVPGDMWVKHKLYDDTNSFFAHNLSSFFSTTEAGFYRGGTSDSTKAINVRLVPDTTYPDKFIPDTPQTTDSSNASNRYGDFDNGPGDCRDGAYINKPDEGNLSAIRLWYPKNNTDGGVRFYRNAYLHDQWMQLPARESFFTPNRMISSPGMLGSLPTGVYGSQAVNATDAKTHGQAWRTLLFRPYTAAKGTGLAVGIHPGAPASVGGVSPADHYIMDLFWMPVVGPYAISDSWSTAGKININFQIVPFTYINRATAVYAAMKGEIITTVPKEDATISNVTQRKGGAQTKSYKQYKDDIIWPPLCFTETDGKYWHRYINLEATTKLMKARMDMDAALPTSAKGLFRSASQMCEVHLVPQNPSTTDAAASKYKVGDITVSGAQAAMDAFWQVHAITGDNTRERPYANLYQKLTTRSNTYRVFYRAQSLKKARSLSPGTVRTVSTGGSSTDTILAEYRGSALIERYLDMSITLPDYASSADPMSLPSLESYYRYRILESKQFAP